MLSRQHQPDPRGDDRERITRARQTAEALFRSKPPVSQPSVLDLPPADQSARKPRELPIVPAAPVHRDELRTPASPEPRATREIARSQFPRIRTLVKYGMTVAQVAKLYGAAVGDIERILRKT